MLMSKSKMLDSNPKCGLAKAKCSLAAWPEGLTVRRRACKGRKPHDFCRVGPKIPACRSQTGPCGLRGQRLGLFLHLVDFPLKSLGRPAVRGLHVIPGQQQRREEAPIECKLKRKSMSAVRRESHGHNVTADGVASQAGIPSRLRATHASS